MAIFITGSTGYIGSYTVAFLLSAYTDNLNLLVRANSLTHAHQKLWNALQLHFDQDQIRSYLERCKIFLGDITLPQLGLSSKDYSSLISSTHSIIHCAASLNRKSEKACLNVNLRGTLEVIKLGRAIQQHHGLTRFTNVSTVAIAGHRFNEIVFEDMAIDWNLSDYDPYARTKKFSEHMIQELLPDVSTVILRPSVVLGDSRFPQTNQFEMARAFAFFAKLPIIPLRADAVIDIVPVDFVAQAIVSLHQKPQPKHKIYHLSAGKDSLSYRKIVESLKDRYIFASWLETSFNRMVNLTASLSRNSNIARAASLLKVFMPYLRYNTVFDNERIVSELQLSPTPFTKYAAPLLEFVKQVNFKYPYKTWQPSSTNLSD